MMTRELDPALMLDRLNDGEVSQLLMETMFHLCAGRISGETSMTILKRIKQSKARKRRQMRLCRQENKTWRAAP